MTTLGAAVIAAYKLDADEEAIDEQWNDKVNVSATWLRRTCAAALMAGADAVECERIVDAAVESMSDGLLEAGLLGIGDGLLAGVSS